MSDSAGSAGEIIYKAFTPTLKMALCILAGFVITKGGMLPPPSTRGISVVTMNISLPCLIFSSMVTAFTPENVTAFGPLALMAILYQVLGFILAWIVRELFYVPKDFRWGILIMGFISNWGNLPTAVVQTMAKEAPFNPSTDVDLGVAYIAIFILIMNTTFFALGTHKLCAWDFVDERMVHDPKPFKLRWHYRIESTIKTIGQWRFLGQGSQPAHLTHDGVAGADTISAQILQDNEKIDEVWKPGIAGSSAIESSQALSHGFVGGANPTCTSSRAPSISARMDSTRRVPPAALSEAPSIPMTTLSKQDALPVHSEHTSRLSFLRRRSLVTLGKVIIRNLPPATWATVLGLPFSLIQPLKALMTDTTGWTGTKMPNAPDGNPPLYFVLETATFLGGITVPMALVLLGASFARLKVPTRWRDLPLLAIASMAAVKMVIIPTFAIFVVQALQNHTTLFPSSQKIRTFVAILLSGTPAAANQLVITQLYNPAGTANTLASFLLLQYALMFVLSTALAAIALYIVR